MATPPYHVPVFGADCAGLVVSLARQETPDTSGYDDPEIVWRLTHHPHHVGLIVKSSSHARVQQLVGDYARRIAHDFSATLPMGDRPEH